MAAAAGDEAEWMMGGDDGVAEQQTRHARSDKRIGGAPPSGVVDSVESSSDWSAQSHVADGSSAEHDSDWPALVQAALADTVDDDDTASALPALSALSAALSRLSASTSFEPHTTSTSSSTSAVASPPSHSSHFDSLWPLLPSLYARLQLAPSSSRHASAVCALVDCVLSLAASFPSSVLLARSDFHSAAPKSDSPHSPPPCLWTALSSAVDARLSELRSVSSDWSCSALCALLRCCASLLPSTLSVLSVYGDVLGCVLPAVHRVTERVRQLLFDPASSPLLVQYAAGVARCVLLTHSPIELVDGLDPLLPASLSASSSSSSRSSVSAPSSSSLSSFPVLSSECALYFPTVSPFDLRLLPASHPDMDKQQLCSVASSLVAQLTEAVRQSVVVSPSVCVYLELLLFVVRQRSVCYAALCLPVLLGAAGQLSSLPVSSPVSAALQTLRLGLFSLFRLSSCSHHWSAMLAVLTQPASSILAMEAQRINKQRGNSHTQLSEARNKQQQQQQQQHEQQPQRQQPHSAGSSFGQSGVLLQQSSGEALPALREVVDVESAQCQQLLLSAFSLPLPLICNLVMRSLHALPMSSSGQQQSGQSQQQVLIQVQAATKQMHWKGADMHTQADIKPTADVGALPLPADGSPTSSTAPPLVTQPLSTSARSSLSRLCFVRLLSTSADLAAGHRVMAALRAALLPNITVVGAFGAIEHTVEVTDSELLTHWAADHQHAAYQHYDEPDYNDDADEDEQLEYADDDDNTVSTRSLVSSLRLSSSLSSSADYNALLSYILSDVVERYELAITFAYKLAQLTPRSLHITATRADSDTHTTEQTVPEVQQPLGPASQQDNDQSGQAHSAASQNQSNTVHDTAQLAALGNDSMRGKRQLAAGDSVTAEQGSNKQQRTAHSGSDYVPRESAQPAVISDDELVEQPHQEAQRYAEHAATQQHSSEAVSYASDSLSPPVVSPLLENDSDGVLRSARFLSVLSSFFRLHGGVEYQQLVDGLITALDSALFSTAATSTLSTVSSPACAALLQLLLDLPLLPPSAWSCIDRYLASSATSSVGLLALRVLIEQRPPASLRAMRMLLRYAAVGGSESVRRSCVELAVDCIATPAASDQLRAIVVQRALKLADAVSDQSFLADLPTITVNIVVPPPPSYEDIQLLPTAAPPHSETSGAGSGAGAAAASAATTVDSSISSLLSAVVGGGTAAPDGSEEADEARRRAIQQLIADGARRKKEFDKLVLRRQLLLKEKEVRERQADERQQQRRQTSQTHLALLFALIRSSPRIAFDSATDETRQLFERLWSVYADTSAAEPTRTLIHSFLPTVVLAVGPTQPLLTSLQSQPVACDPCVLHVLQLLCAAPATPEESHFGQQQLAALSAGTREQSLVHPTSAVSVVCWYLYHIRRGDARFIIPLLPMLRADQLRRCLHRIVALPPVHLKVALHRMLRPHLSFAAKGNRLTQPHPQPLSPAELVIALHRIDQHRRAALPSNTQPRPENNGSEAGSPPVSLPLTSPLPVTVDLSVCSASSAASNYPSDDGSWLRSLIAAVQLCFASVDLFPPSTLASVLSALRVDRPLSRLFLRTCIQCVQLQASLTSFVLSVVHSLIRSERSMVGVSLLWEGVLKLASLSLPSSLDLLLDLPDEGVARLFGSVAPSSLVSAVHKADQATSEAAADKAAGRKAAKPAKQTPLQMCQVAVARAILQQPQRVRPVYRKHVMPTSMEPQPYHHPLHPLPIAASSAASDIPLPLPPAAPILFGPPPAFSDRPGWLSSHPPALHAGPTVQSPHPPMSSMHPASAAAGGGVISYSARPSVLPTAAPSTDSAPFVGAPPPFHRPFPVHPSQLSHAAAHAHLHTPHQPPIAVMPPFQSAPLPPPMPAPQLQSAGGGWKSVRIPAVPHSNQQPQPQPANSSHTASARYHSGR